MTNHVITIVINDEILKKIDKLVNERIEFTSRSHVIRVALDKFLKEMEHEA